MATVSKPISNKRMVTIDALFCLPLMWWVLSVNGCVVCKWWVVSNHQEGRIEKNGGLLFVLGQLPLAIVEIVCGEGQQLHQ
jgi:hypothetical protein